MITKKKKVIMPDNENKEYYSEGTDGYIFVLYVGKDAIKVVGCKTKNRYLFSPGVARHIDANDADCLFDFKPGLFEIVLEELDFAESDSGENKIEFPES